MRASVFSVLKIILGLLLLGPLVLAVLPALIVPFVICVIWNGPRAVNVTSRWVTKVRTQGVLHTLRKHWLIAAAVIGAVSFTIIYYLEDFQWFLFWIATITGNWAKDKPAIAGGPILFALSILVAIILNVGQFATVLLYGHKIVVRVTELERKMSHYPLSGILDIQGFAFLGDSYAKIDEIRKSEGMSDLLVNKLKAAIKDSVQNKGSFNSALSIMAGSKDEEAKAALREFLSRAMVDIPVANLKEGP